MNYHGNEKTDADLGEYHERDRNQKDSDGTFDGKIKSWNGQTWSTTETKKLTQTWKNTKTDSRWHLTQVICGEKNYWQKCRLFDIGYRWKPKPKLFSKLYERGSNSFIYTISLFLGSTLSCGLCSPIWPLNVWLYISHNITFEISRRPGLGRAEWDRYLSKMT